jgi:hypothetical protein
MIENKLEFKDNTTESLFFDPEPHKYYWNEQEVPSATNICKILTPAAAIGNWSTKLCSEKFKELVVAGKSYDEIQILEMAEQIKKAPNTFMQQAGTAGSYVHDAIEKYIHHKEEPNFTNEGMAKSFAKFKEWYGKQKAFEVVSTESRILSRKHFFTGTYDALFKNADNEYTIYDWKTSSGIRDSYLVQIFLYSIGLEEQFDIKISNGVIVNTTKEGKLNIKTFEVNKEMQEIALACLKVFQFLNPKFKPNKGEK